MNHLSKLEEEAIEKLGDDFEIGDYFLDERVLEEYHNLIPWFANFANYLACDLISKDLSFQQQWRFMHEVRKFFIDESYLFRVCAYGVI